MRQESANFIGGQMMRDRPEARWTLLHGAGWTLVDHMAIGAPLPGELASASDIGIGSLCERIGRRSRANLRSPSRSAVGGYPISVEAEPTEEK